VSYKQQFAAVAGASFVAISQLATVSSLNHFHRIAIIGFFIVLPMCVVGFVSSDEFAEPNAKTTVLDNPTNGGCEQRFVRWSGNYASLFFRKLGGLCVFLTVIGIAPFAICLWRER